MEGVREEVEEKSGGGACMLPAAAAHLRLVRLSRIANTRDRQLRVLHTIALLTALAHSTAVVADDRRLAKVSVDAVIARRVRDGDIDIVHPRHALGDQHL